MMCECIDGKCSCMVLARPKHKCLEMFIYQLRACQPKKNFRIFQTKMFQVVDIKFSKFDMNKSGAILVLFWSGKIFVQNHFH